MNFNPLQSVWIAYQSSQSCFKITERVINRAVQDKLVVKTIFYQQPETQAHSFLQLGKAESEDLFVLAVWATFERFLRSYLQTKAEKLRDLYPPALASSFYQQLYRELEFWKPDDMLDLLKSILPGSNLIGQAKQILEYRDWVAHGKNPENHPSANITPKFAYNTLTEIVQLIQLN